MDGVDAREGVKQSLRGKRLPQASHLNPENKCKWGVLQKLSAPFRAGEEPEELSDALEAESWDDIDERIKLQTDAAWAIEKARIARAQEEQQQLAERAAKQEKRKQQRYAAEGKVRQFARDNKYAIVHESSKAKSPDPLAAENPLSLAYKGRRTRKRKAAPAPSPSPEPPPAAVEKAAALGVELVSPHKSKRQMLSRQRSEDEEKEVEQLASAADALSDSAKRQLLARLQATTPTATGATGKRSRASKARGSAANAAEADEAAKAAAAARKQQQVADYFAKMLRLLNRERAKTGAGRLNKASREALRKLCEFHAHEPINAEAGFVGSALARNWYDQFHLDLDKYPAAADDDVDPLESDSE